MGDMSFPGRAQVRVVLELESYERYDSFDILSDEDRVCESATVQSSLAPAA